MRVRGRRGELASWRCGAAYKERLLIDDDLDRALEQQMKAVRCVTLAEYVVACGELSLFRLAHQAHKVAVQHAAALAISLGRLVQSGV